MRLPRNTAWRCISRAIMVSTFTAGYMQMDSAQMSCSRVPQRHAP